MNKRIILLIILSLCLSFISPANAQLPSGDQVEKINERVDELKNKVASKVAELNLVEKRGIVGIVESVTDNQITLNDIKNNRRIIDVDEITKFSSEENGALEISDIKKGSEISVLGLYNKDSQRLLARFINEISIPLFINGVISEKDDENFTVSITTSNNEKYLVDVDRITKTLNYVDGDLESSGFSKITIGITAVASGFEDPKEKNRISATRIIFFPGTPKDPNIKFKIESLSPTPTPPEE